MHIFQHDNGKFNFSRLFAMSIVATLLIVFASTSDAYAQRRKAVLGGKKANGSDKKSEAQPGRPNATAGNSNLPGLTARPKKKKDEDDEFAPQVVTMTVKREGIQLVATWFPPIIEEEDSKKKRKTAAQRNKPGEAKPDPEPGKSVVPFILVHDWARNRTDLLQLASFLQSQGHAVIVPDLRGHGQSVRVAGMDKLLDHRKFKKSDKGSTFGDIDQCKRFLQEKNNEGLLNIDLLNVVAVGDSCHVAIAWALADWSWEPVAGIKQGKDVKSLILFSPTAKFAGSSLRKLAKEPMISGRKTAALPMLVIWGGNNSDDAEECNAFVRLLRKSRPEAPRDLSEAQRWQVQNLFHFEAPTQMTGFQLAGNPNAKKIWSFANNFVAQKVVEFKDQFPWQIRGADAVLKAREALEK